MTHVAPHLLPPSPFQIVGGGDFASLLHEPLSELCAKFYVASLVLVTAHLHTHRIACRDLKPESLMIDSHGYLMLVYLSFAKVRRAVTRSRSDKCQGSGYRN